MFSSLIAQNLGGEQRAGAGNQAFRRKLNI